MKNEPSTAASFLNTTKACDLKVRFLYGKHEWIMPEHRQEAIDLVSSTIQFQNTAQVVATEQSACPTTYIPSPTPVGVTRRRRRRRRRRCQPVDAGVKDGCAANLVHVGTTEEDSDGGTIIGVVTGLLALCGIGIGAAIYYFFCKTPSDAKMAQSSQLSKSGSQS